ncbi:hypothetical protein GCM10017772_07040 [Promicromonospora soli]|uniref:Uncharacterized protein n=1 Tax=Promicromonospora soli TaxID=2035533 RepID=A0A919FIU1_9MICO|nr:hypothetical protein GCM10017772_07040 [Promicromonospora soli]
MSIPHTGNDGVGGVARLSGSSPSHSDCLPAALDAECHRHLGRWHCGATKTGFDGGPLRREMLALTCAFPLAGGNAQDSYERQE